MCDYINALFDMREKYMLPTINEIANLKPVYTRANRETRIPEYLKDYVC